MSSGDRGIIRWVYENQRPALVRDLKFEEFWRDMYYLVEDDIRSELDVPLLDDGKVLGVLNFESDQPSAFNAVDQQFLEVLAGQAVLAIKNATALMKYSQGYELLREVGQKLGAIAELTSLDGALDQAYAVVVAVADDQFKCQVVIRRYDPQTRELVLKRVARTMEPPPFPRMALSEGVNGQLAQACQENPADESCDTCMVYDVLRPPPGLELKLSDPATHSLVVTPIVFQGQYYGNLGLSHPEPNYFKYTHLPLIEALAQELATTIHRLETLHAKQEAERRAHELEAMSWIGRQAFAFAHRLSGDLGLIRTQIERIRDDLREHGIENRRVNKRLDGMTNRIQPLLDEIGGLKKQLTEYVSTGRSLPKPKREDVVIKGLLKDVVERLAAKLPDRIQIDTQITDDVAAARVVSAQVADILHNLIENSIQAITGDGTITLRAYNDGRYVALQVADTGIGIPEDKAGQLFNLAFGTRGSSGFGLWSSLLTAFENGGDLRLTNTQVGVGTTFTLRLPRADLDAATAGLVASPDEPVGSAV
jgi:signal transduction histidine kinase